MRKTRVIALVFLLALLLSWSARADFEELMMDGVIVNCNEYVTLRSRPSTKATAIERVRLGEYVTLLTRNVYEDNGDYFVLVETDREVGYVLIAYVDAILHDYDDYANDYYGIGYGTVTADDPSVDLILRDGPGTEYAALGYLFGGEVISSLGVAQADQNGRLWYCCELDSEVCWISSKYTRLRRPN